MEKYSLEKFIDKANKIHKNKYDYSKVEYVDSQTKVCIICPKHGEFWQTPYSHLAKHGCPECKGLKKLTKEIFLERANKVHNNKYTYENAEVHGIRSKIPIICPIHGKFLQAIKNHLNGQGCPLCGKKFAKEWQQNKYEEFVDESKKRFGDVYEFPNIEKMYINSHSKILVKCKKCGNIFEKIACDHLTSPSGGCRHCYFVKSKAEEELATFIKELLRDDVVEFGNRNILNGFELDIFIPSKNIAIEYNGLFWHSTPRKDKNYHLTKLEKCENENIRLIQIFEDEWLLNKEIVKNKLKHLLGCDVNSDKIMGRKCKIEEIPYQISKDFLDTNHIQGSSKSSVYLGALFDNVLIGVMTFKREKDIWELTRFATIPNKKCQGVGGKLLSYFIKKYKPTKIKSFADRRWCSKSDNIYLKLGFVEEKKLLPDYRYFFNGSLERLHKFNFRKEVLNKKYGYPMSMTESEMTKSLGVNKIYDCGLIKYVMTICK